MKKVLIAVDYHPNATEVVKAGYDLAKTLNAKVCLLHVVMEFGYYNTQYPTFMGYDSFSMGSNMNIHEDLLEVSDNYLTKISGYLEDPHVETRTEEGETADTILDYAKKWKANIIVMGTHSHSVLEKLLMGNVAKKVLEHSNVPIYMVPIKNK